MKNELRQSYQVVKFLNEKLAEGWLPIRYFYTDRGWSLDEERNCAIGILLTENELRIIQEKSLAGYIVEEIFKYVDFAEISLSWLGKLQESSDRSLNSLMNFLKESGDGNCIE